MGTLAWKCELLQFHNLPVEMVGYVEVPPNNHNLFWTLSFQVTLIMHIGNLHAHTLAYLIRLCVLHHAPTLLSVALALPLLI